MIIWYISTGSGRGNPYGLAVITAVCFPFFFFVRLYWPGPPMTNLIVMFGIPSQGTKVALFVTTHR
ncbi:hypothetical protein EIP86_009416 [Pleurotus ostreatoroseus]|nr:hypothetical protein EIP86_009416 [Pleurotus ostreatoroseus]